MEAIFDIHIGHLVDRVREAAETGNTLDLKSAFAFYGYDVTGQLAFDTEFNTQVKHDPKDLPPLNDHFLLGNIYGSIANLLPHIKTCTTWVPWVHALQDSRKKLAGLASTCVNHAVANHKQGGPARTLLTSLINAKDPETGATLSISEINSEAFGFLYAPLVSHFEQKEAANILQCCRLPYNRQQFDTSVLSYAEKSFHYCYCGQGNGYTAHKQFK